jgi:nitrogen regulatory protein P-II 2
MKLVAAIIKPFRLDEVREALCDIDVTGVTVSEVNGLGRQKAQGKYFRGDGYMLEFIPRIRIEAAVEDSAVDPVVETLSTAARTGEVGDGRIFVIDLGQAVRIRTGEVGPEAL